MTQSKLVVLVLATIIVIGGAYVALKPKVGIAPTGTEEIGTLPVDSEATPEESSKKMTFSDFLAQGGSYKCAVNQSVQGTEIEGTTYLNNGMIRGEYTTQTQGVKIDSHVIVRDGIAYSWSSMMPTRGFKSVVAPNTAQNTGTPSAGTYAWNAEQIGDYSCEKWDADTSLFELPSAVTFSEIH